MVSSINNDREGVVYIEDLAGASWTSFTRVSQYDMKELLGAMRHAMPLRIRAIHILHAPWYLRILITMVSPFMKSKLLERVRFSIILPSEYLLSSTDKNNYCGGTYPGHHSKGQPLDRSRW
jgi:hypothetical protein